jgi:hypothetical protein
MVNLSVYFGTTDHVASARTRGDWRRLVRAMTDALAVATPDSGATDEATAIAGDDAVVVEVQIDNVDQFIAVVSVARYWVSRRDARAVGVAHNRHSLQPSPADGVVELSDSSIGPVALGQLIDDSVLRSLFAAWDLAHR